MNEANPHPLLDIQQTSKPIEEYLASIGEVSLRIEGQDSGNTSFRVAVAGEHWFVKYSEEPEAVEALRNAIAFHELVRDRAIVPIRAAFRTQSGLATVSPWVPGEILNDPRLPGGLPYNHPDSTLARFRALPSTETLSVLDTIIDAHVAVVAAGFVAVDFYDGCVLYDFDQRVAQLCDLDLYRPGPFALDRDRQWGSTRYMAPEEFERGSFINERTTVFNLGRAAFVFLGPTPRGETERTGWRGPEAIYRVAMQATAPPPHDRFESVALFAAAWRAARG